MTDAAPLSDQAATAWARLVRVSQSLLDAVEADLKAAGMPPLVWYDALLELRRADPDGLRPFELQSRMLLAQYNLSRLLDRIVRAGYAERLPCHDDARGHLLRITASGHTLLQSMWPAHRQAVVRHFAARLEAEEAVELGRLLGKLRDAAGATPGGATVPAVAAEMPARRSPAPPAALTRLRRPPGGCGSGR